MKNSIMIGIGMLVCLFIFLPTVHAGSGKPYKVDSATVALRDAPDENATVLAELKNGEAVTIFQESFGWGKTFYNGKEAWSALHHLAAVNDPETEQGDAEQQPDAKEQQIQTATSSDINTESNESVESGQLYEVNVPVARLRNAPDENATIMTKLNNGEAVTIFQESFGWGKTFYNGQEMWIALYLLDKKSESTESVMSEANEEADPQQTKATEKEASETQSVPKDEKELEIEPSQKEDEKKSEAEPSQKNKKDDEKEKMTVETKDKEKNEDVQAKQSGEKTLSGYHFVIDAGHGGKDTGAIGSNVYEKTLTLATAKQVEQQLHAKGATVTLTRTDDTFIPLDERVKISNSTDTDVFISLHYNAFEDQSVRGIYTFYYNGVENEKLANSVQKSLINYVNFTDRGTKQADYQVLKDNKQPALLIELGFISNPEEQKIVQNDSFQEKAAKGIVAGLEDYYK